MSLSLELITTLHPSDKSFLAISKPIPLEAPVTNTFLFLILDSISRGVNLQI